MSVNSGLINLSKKGKVTMGKVCRSEWGVILEYKDITGELCSIIGFGSTPRQAIKNLNKKLHNQSENNE